MIDKKIQMYKKMIEELNNTIKYMCSGDIQGDQGAVIIQRQNLEMLLFEEEDKSEFEKNLEKYKRDMELNWKVKPPPQLYEEALKKEQQKLEDNNKIWEKK